MYISDLIIKDTQQVSMDELFFDQETKATFSAFLREHAYADELRKYNLPLNNKILLHGSSGCGKTSTAKAIAASLQKDLLVLNLGNVVSSRMGETAQHVKMVFDKAAKNKSVLFLDEFDQIGKLRSLEDRDVGEMRRLINTILQLIDYYPEEALLICATNHLSFIDPALLRRFQLKVGFTMPGRKTLDDYYDTLLMKFPEMLRTFPREYDISFAEAKDYAFTRVKSNLITSIEARKIPDEV